MQSDEIKRLNLIRLMEERNIKPADLARLIDVKPSYVSSLLKKTGEQGSRNIGPRTIEKLCEKLGVTEKEFFVNTKERVQIPHLDYDADMALAQSIVLLTNIYHSKDQMLIRAIYANLQAFNESVERKRKEQEQEEQMSKMEQRIQSLEQKLKRAENLEDSCSKQEEKTGNE